MTIKQGLFDALGENNTRDTQTLRSNLESFLDDQKISGDEIHNAIHAYEGLTQAFASLESLKRLVDSVDGHMTTAMEQYVEGEIRRYSTQLGVKDTPSLEGFLDMITGAVKNIFSRDPTKMLDKVDIRKYTDVIKDVERLVTETRRKIDKHQGGSALVSDKVLLRQFARNGVVHEDLVASVESDLKCVNEALLSYAKYSKDILDDYLNAFRGAVSDGDWRKHATDAFQLNTAFEAMPPKLFEDDVFIQSRRLVRLTESNVYDKSASEESNHFFMMIAQPPLRFVEIPMRGDVKTVDVKDVKEIAYRLVDDMETYLAIFKAVQAYLVDFTQQSLFVASLKAKFPKNDNAASMIYSSIVANLMATEGTQIALSEHAGRSIKAISQFIDQIIV